MGTSVTCGFSDVTGCGKGPKLMYCYKLLSIINGYNLDDTCGGSDVLVHDLQAKCRNLTRPQRDSG
jgi:hypothetical protein